MIGPDDERPKHGDGAFEDAVAVELCDLDRGVCALVRLTRTAGGGATALALLWHGGRTVSTLEETVAGRELEDWDRAELAGAGFETAEPLARWSCRLEVEGADLQANLEAVSTPIDFDGPATAPLARAAGVHGYEQLCRARGVLRFDGAATEINGVGRRVHSWGEPSAVQLRSVYAVAGDRAVTLTAVRGEGEAHGSELIAAHLLRPESPPEPFEEARLSTIYDGTGRPRSAGLELLLAGDDYPHRASGEAVCQADAAAVQAACFRWSLEGEPAQGGYQLIAPR
jgi:hypothetical protein